jgi:hypothetical protein
MECVLKLPAAPMCMMVDLQALSASSTSRLVWMEQVCESPHNNTTQGRLTKASKASCTSLQAQYLLLCSPACLFPHVGQSAGL